MDIILSFFFILYITIINFILFITLLSVLLETNEDLVMIPYVLFLLVCGLFYPLLAYLTLGVLASGISASLLV